MSGYYHVKDKYFLKAKEEGFRARSAYKLLDIQKKFHLIKPGNHVLDLGAAPGSFMQVLGDLVGQNGRVLGVDLQEIETFDDARLITLQADIMEKEQVLAAVTQAKLAPVDVVTSDLAPRTSGIRDLDQGLSAELTDQAFFLATQVLKPGGHFVGKIFEGPDLQWLLHRMKKKFNKVNVFKAPSTRGGSFESFIVAQGFKG
jgi:23S rRNA (uridine2552-2'-O)-methyltransferase